MRRIQLYQVGAATAVQDACILSQCPCAGSRSMLIQEAAAVSAFIAQHVAMTPPEALGKLQQPEFFRNRNAAVAMRDAVRKPWETASGRAGEPPEGVGKP